MLYLVPQIGTWIAELPTSVPFTTDTANALSDKLSLSFDRVSTARTILFDNTRYYNKHLLTYVY